VVGRLKVAFEKLNRKGVKFQGKEKESHDEKYKEVPSGLKDDHIDKTYAKQ